MAFTLTDYGRSRPYLYHLTSRANLPGITASRRLLSASSTLRMGGKANLVGRRRLEMLPVHVPGGMVLLRDQSPLIAANVAFTSGWTLTDLILEINSRVFFWPGWAHGPIRHGLNHFGRYHGTGEALVVLRVPFRSLQQHNRRFRPEFCKYNSGSPRCNNGNRSPRGAGTFLPELAFADASADVVEVTFRDSVALPADTEAAASPTGGWAPLFTQRGEP